MQMHHFPTLSLPTRPDYSLPQSGQKRAEPSTDAPHSVQYLLPALLFLPFLWAAPPPTRRPPFFAPLPRDEAGLSTAYPPKTRATAPRTPTIRMRVVLLPCWSGEACSLEASPEPGALPGVTEGSLSSLL